MDETQTYTVADALFWVCICCFVFFFQKISMFFISVSGILLWILCNLCAHCFYPFLSRFVKGLCHHGKRMTWTVCQSVSRQTRSLTFEPFWGSNCLFSISLAAYIRNHTGNHTQVPLVSNCWLSILCLNTGFLGWHDENCILHAHRGK